MGAYVVVELTRDLGDELAGRASASPAGRKLKKILAEHEAVVLPASMPATDESDAATYTTIEVPDMKRATRLATVLRSMPGVESAFAKPGEEMP